ncbi:MAG: nucleoside triphosphate pyrophosphohydrolase [Lentisphaeria bacterium]|jgi:tetrapyrrole methylase family protein/MazG family protein|nr:nucleoside triphosphate pyrophosphohydrolase [Lentisphaeria bacterium]
MTQPDSLHELVRIMARLRSPDGCPWDREQTHQSLVRYLVEETGEFLDALDDGDDDGMADELGDLLLQIVFHARIAEEEGRFTIEDVARGECDKMLRRHPHVFAEGQAETPAAVVDQWETIKRGEKGRKPRESALDGVPRHLPALHRAQKILDKVGKVGFRWPDLDGALAKVEEEWAELREALEKQDQEAVGEELADLIFTLVNVGHMAGIRAEESMHAGLRKFERRFRRLELLVADDGRSTHACTPEELARYWRRATELERSEPTA